MCFGGQPGNSFTLPGQEAVVREAVSMKWKIATFQANFSLENKDSFLKPLPKYNGKINTKLLKWNVFSNTT